MSQAETDAHLLVETDQKILSITLNRPQKRNALTVPMYEGISKALKEAEQNDQIHVAVIKGSESCFTGGNDLADFMNEPFRDIDHPVAQFLHVLAGFKKPLIAALSGAAVGIGTTLLLHCDLAYATPSTRLQLPFTNLGLVPEAGSSLLLPALMGHQRASELLLLGEPFSARKALEVGLINDIYPEQTIMEEVYKVAAKIAKKSPTAMQLSKSLLKKQWSEVLPAVINHELHHFIERLSSPEAKQAFQAFFEKEKAPI